MKEKRKKDGKGIYIYIYNIDNYTNIAPRFRTSVWGDGYKKQGGLERLYKQVLYIYMSSGPWC